MDHLSCAIQDIRDLDEISHCNESEKVAVTIAGYVVKKIEKRYSCCECKTVLTDNNTDSEYFNRLTRGKLAVPSALAADFVCKGFALLDHYDACFSTYTTYICPAASYVLLQCLHDRVIACPIHQKFAFNLAVKIIVNIFFNNKQKLANDMNVKNTITGFKKGKETNSKHELPRLSATTDYTTIFNDF